MTKDNWSLQGKEEKVFLGLGYHIDTIETLRLKLIKDVFEAFDEGHLGFKEEIEQLINKRFK